MSTTTYILDRIIVPQDALEKNWSRWNPGDFIEVGQRVHVWAYGGGFEPGRECLVVGFTKLSGRSSQVVFDPEGIFVIVRPVGVKGGDVMYTCTPPVCGIMVRARDLSPCKALEKAGNCPDDNNCGGQWEPWKKNTS